MYIIEVGGKEGAEAEGGRVVKCGESERMVASK